MRVTIDFLRKRFSDFNHDYFADSLPTVSLRISSSLRTLGSVRHPRKFSSNLRAEQVILSISNRLDLEADIIEDTIIHEMIHLYIFWNNLRDTSSHGRVFRKIMADINSKHGRHITISHKGNLSEKKSDRITKNRIVLVSTLNDGKKAVTVCTPSYSLRVYRQLESHPMIRDVRVMVSADPFFGQFPASRTAKVYKINEAQLEDSLRNAVRYEFRDGKFLRI